MTDIKKVVFAPGCFDNLDVDSQEELDSMVAEITAMFETMTSEELEANSQSISLEELAEAMDIDPEEVSDMIENLRGPKKILQ